MFSSNRTIARWLFGLFAQMVFVYFYATPVHAQSLGSIDYNTGTDKLEFWNGSSWVTFGDDTISGLCGKAGEFEYDFINNIYQYCDGINWRDFTAEITSSSCTTAGELDFNVSTNVFEFCNGSFWVRAEPVQARPGFFIKFVNTAVKGGVFGSLANADGICYNNLNTHSWMNKADAGAIVPQRVKAFLCDDSTCNNLSPDTTYQYATTGMSTYGGATFTTDSMGRGPNDALDWSDTTAFYYTVPFWSGRAAGTSTVWATTPSGNSCSNWSSSGSGSNGTVGAVAATDSTRWSDGTNTCDQNRPYVCYLNPTPYPFDFVDKNSSAGGVWVESDIIKIYGNTTDVPVSISGTGNPEFRTCTDSSCSSVVSPWGSTATTISPNQYLQLRLISHHVQSSSYTATVSVDYTTDDWSVWTTGSSADGDPDPFSFTDQVNVSALTQITSDIVQLTGFDSNTISVSGATGIPEYRTCSDPNCLDVIYDWSNSTNSVGNNVYVQMRMTSESLGGVTNTATLTIGATSTTWSLTSKKSPRGFFVMLDTDFVAGSIGGLAAANEICFDALSAGDFNGKADAHISRKYVKAFLCNDSTCNNLNPSTQYYFAHLAGVSAGGQSFTTNASGLGPTTSGSWSNITFFGSYSSDYIWTGRDLGSASYWSPNPFANNTCSGFSSFSGTGRMGRPSNTGDDRWSYANQTCMMAYPFVCFINAAPTPDAFSFTPVAGASVATQYESDIVQTSDNLVSGFIEQTTSVGSLEFRTCSDAACSSVINDWSYDPVAVDDGDYIQLRMLSSGLPSTTVTTTVAIGMTSASWDITTGSAVIDDTPDAFTIPSSNSVTVNYESSSVPVQLLGFDSSTATVSGAEGDPELRVCADSNCTSILSSWSAGPSSVNEGDYIQVKMMSAPTGWTLRTATVTVGSTSSVWDQTTGVTGFFVLSAGVTKGNMNGLSGLAGADAVCLTDLQSNDWKGKANAGTLTAAKVRAFLCDSTTCQLPYGGSPYTFATSGDTSAGGEVFFATSSGQGPGDSAMWSDLGYFNTSASYWTNHDNASPFYWGTTQIGVNCSDWSSGGGGSNAYYGSSGTSTASRWSANLNSCNSSYHLICMVDIDVDPDAFTFTDLTGQSENTLVTSNIVLMSGFDSLLTFEINGHIGDPEFRVCSANDCSSVVTDWSSTPSSVQAGDYVQLRLTTGPGQGVITEASVTIGTQSGTWTVTTSGTSAKGYLVMTSGTYDGNFGGRAAFESTCLSELTTYDWTGKSSAGTLTADRVTPWTLGEWLSKDHPYVRYEFATANDLSAGGAGFTTDELGRGPGDNANWSTQAYFNSTDGYWRGDGGGSIYDSYSFEGIETLTGTNACNQWTSASNSADSNYGLPNATDRNRWWAKPENGVVKCSESMRLVCHVRPDVFNTPTFDFIDQSGVAVSTYIASNIEQITGLELPVKLSVAGPDIVQYRICADSSCTTERVSWTSDPANTYEWVYNNEYVQIRNRSSSVPGLSHNITVSIGETTEIWKLTTSGTARPTGYFVMSNGTWNGGLGSVEAANSLCLTDLTTNNWKDKASAPTLTSQNVKAFLCRGPSDLTCQSPLGYTEYVFNVSGDVAAGGASFTSTGNWIKGDGPHGSTDWSASSHFNGAYSYWTGQVDTHGFDPELIWGNYGSRMIDDRSCANWTDSTSASTGEIGMSDETDSLRWRGDLVGCDETHHLICMVHPDIFPNSVSFTDLTGQTASTLVQSDIVQITGISTAETPITFLGGVNGAQMRYCDASDCSGTNSSWDSDYLTVPANYYLQLQLTSSAAPGGTVKARVRLGGEDGEEVVWSVTNTGTLNPGYLVLTESTWAMSAIGGQSGADAKCYSELSGKTWMGKSSAGTLTTARVKALTCATSTAPGCNNLLADTAYKFAKAGDAAVGGAEFTTDSSGLGPNDEDAWSDSEHFSVTGPALLNRSSMSSYRWGTGTASSSPCSGMTAGSGQVSYLLTGFFGFSDSYRWRHYSPYLASCSDELPIVCYVNPE